MREIKFRGYSKLNNMWYYGLLGKFDNKYYIECEGGTKPFVEEDSIGQYTGFKDKNGKEIYEGDILDYIGDENDYVSDFEDKDKKVVIEWWKKEHNGWQLVFFNIKNEHSSMFPYMFYWLNDFHANECEVVGNTYEEKEEQKVG